MGEIELKGKKNDVGFMNKAPSLLFFFSILFLLIDYLSYHGPLFILIITGVIAIFLLFIDQKKFVYFTTILLLLSDDQSKFVTLGGKLVKSIIGHPLAGNTILVYLLVVALIKIIFDTLLKKKFKFSLNIYEQILIIISFLYILAAITGLPNLFTYSSIYIAQLSPIVAIIIGYILIKTTFRSKDELINFFKILALAFTGRVIVMSIQFIATGVDVYAMGQFSYSSVIQFILIPLYFWIGLLIWRYRWKKPIISKIFVIILIALILFNCYTAGARYVLLSFAISLILSFLILAFSLPKFIKIIGSLGIIFVVLVIFMAAFSTKDFLYYVSKSNHLLDWRLQPTSGTTTIATREIEAINILGRLYSTNSLIWGRGLGDYFTSEYYPLPPVIYEREGRSAYPIEWLNKDQFFKPHHPFIQMLLQFGVVGLLIYLSLLFLIFYNIFKGFHRAKDPKIKIIFFSLFVGSFPILTSNWSLATNYLFGLILAVAALASRFSQQDSIEKPKIIN